jgi:ABC-type Fe3+/spermidine/putrescine transport system ATPase subunit
VERSEYILKTENVSNNYGGKALLQNINLEISKGEIVCLLGPSGSGKTTLLRIIAGLETNYEGSIKFGNRDIDHLQPHKRGFGMMFQEYALFPHKNVEENIGFGLEMQKKSAAHIKHRVTEMVDLVGLSGFEKRVIDELSGGERQRVALARSLAPNPELILLDEPLGSLDRSLRERLTIEIRNILKKLNVTAIVVTHDQKEAFNIADKVAVLHSGVIEQFCTPERLYRHPLSLRTSLFLGFTNHLQGEFDAQTGIFHTSVGPFSLPETTNRTPGKKTLLIRPEGAILDTDNLPRNSNRVSLCGTLTRISYQGATYKVNLCIGTEELTFSLPLEPVPKKDDEKIWLSIPLSSFTLINSPNSA